MSFELSEYLIDILKKNVQNRKNLAAKVARHILCVPEISVTCRKDRQMQTFPLCTGISCIHRNFILTFSA